MTEKVVRGSRSTARSSAIQVRINHTLANTDAKRMAFIESLKVSANVTKSCVAASIARKTAYRWRKDWVTFRQQWDDALEEACDVLEQVARDVAVVDKNPQMLMFLLKSHRPHVYDRRTLAETMKVEVDSEGTKITVARVAPGVLDRLLDDSPILEKEDR